ncbi:MAG: hypothetical protein NT133_17885 [Alphaproteobacteria bacterium]|nr:hypothetical protein [Alphaproteobacteria bacterium]
MTTFVTVNTSASTSVLVPFTSAANAALAQAALDDGPNSVASVGGGIFKYFSPTVGGIVAAPTVNFLGGVAQTTSQTVIYNILPGNYQDLVNAGSGTAIAIGGAQASVWSGQNATTVWLNTNPNGKAFLGGGNDVIQNAFSFANIMIEMDGAPGGALGGSTLILDDQIGGGATVNAHGGDLIVVNTGGRDSIIANDGTVVVETFPGTGSVHGIATVSAVAGADVWVGVGDGPTYITPGAGNAFVFAANASGESTATLFGGTHVFAGQTVTAAAYTGRTTVLGMNGYLQAGSAGGSIISGGTTNSAATLVAGGAGDVLFVNALGDVASLGNALNVIAATNVDLTGKIGGTFIMGSGTGQALGAQQGHNTFIFQGAGTYTVAGFHDSANLTGSIYKDAATGAGGAGNITIADFFPQQIQTVTVAGGGTATIGTAIFDQFDTGGKAISSLNSTAIGGGFFNNVAVLSDGTTINFNTTIGQVHIGAGGTLLV